MTIDTNSKASPDALKALMVLGCTSDSGKSLLVTALARWFSRQGVDVAPFKAQNMSNNARVVEGGEIGVAQWLQARAAQVAPEVDLNPVLLKPEADDRSQVVVSGKVRDDVTEMPWRERGPTLWPIMADAFDRVHANHDLVLVEGAGSPAEINLPDLVNNRVLEHANASALLVSDIDRGGSFAHLFGTWSLVPDSTRTRLAGFVLNKFRGDASLLAPGPEMLTELTAMPLAGVMPMLEHELPDEEGGTIRASPAGCAPSVAIIRYPYASNLDEFQLLGHAAHVRWATRPTDLDGCDFVILPGSKHVAADLSWMRETRMDSAVLHHVAKKTRVLGICGGAMMLGDSIEDPAGLEGEALGLGVLRFRTVMTPGKLTRPTHVAFRGLDTPWNALNGISAPGYEIRFGEIHSDGAPTAPLLWANGSVLATPVHGLLESPDLLHALFGIRPPETLECTFELLADAVDEHLDTQLLKRLVGL